MIGFLIGLTNSRCRRRGHFFLSPHTSHFDRAIGTFALLSASLGPVAPSCLRLAAQRTLVDQKVLELLERHVHRVDAGLQMVPE